MKKFVPKASHLRRLIFTILSCLMILSIGGCGRDDAGAPDLKTGVFIDSAVSGLNYQTSSGQTGITNAGGQFRYVDGLHQGLQQRQLPAQQGGGAGYRTDHYLNIQHGSTLEVRAGIDTAFPQ